MECKTIENKEIPLILMPIGQEMLKDTPFWNGVINKLPLKQAFESAPIPNFDHLRVCSKNQKKS